MALITGLFMILTRTFNLVAVINIQKRIFFMCTKRTLTRKIIYY